MTLRPLDELAAEWELGTAVPAFATRPTPGACHELAMVEKVAAALGTPLLPWQRLVARVATEHDPKTGIYRYPMVIVTVPRQSGKTTLIRALFLARCLRYKRRSFAVFAQTGKDARQRLMDLADQVEDAVFAKRMKINRGQTNPSITATNSGSRILSFAPTAESTHGWTFDGALIDELFAFEEDQAEHVMGALIPSMATKPHQQTYLVSTKGTAASVYLNARIDDGRTASIDPTSSLAFFEWSLADGLDGFDPGNWGFHPGVSAGLIGPDVLTAASRSLSKGEFLRAFCNITTVGTEDVLSADKWRAQAGPLPDPPTARTLSYGYEVAKNGARAAVVAAWRDEGGRMNVRLVASQPGVDWLRPMLMELARTRPRALAADRFQQNTVVHDEVLRESKLWDRYFSTLAAPEWSTACAGFKQRFDAGTLRHENDPALTRGVLGATTASMGRDSWKFSHESPPELLAMVVAVRLADQVHTRRVGSGTNPEPATVAV